LNKITLQIAAEIMARPAQVDAATALLDGGDRGRNACCQAPPAQIRTCPI